MTRLRMLHSYALVRMDSRIAHSEGGLEIPDANRRQPQWGTVMAVGKGRCMPLSREPGEVQCYRYQPTEIQVGDRVRLGAFNGWELTALKCPSLAEGCEGIDLFDGHQWWAVETFPAVQMDWNPLHPGDVYLYERSEECQTRKSRSSTSERSGSGRGRTRDRGRSPTRSAARSSGSRATTQR